MAGSNITAQQTQDLSGAVPRHVVNVNRIAEKCGLAVTVRIGEAPREWQIKESEWIGRYGHEGFNWMRGEAVLSTWSGTEAQLLATGLLRRSYHVPQTRVGWITEPHCGPWHVEVDRPFLCGFIKVSRGRVSLDLYGGPRPTSIQMVGDVEVVEYADVIAYCGSREALLQTRLCDSRHFPSVMPGKYPRRKSHCRFDDEEREWTTRLYPDGNFVHWRETEEASRRRIAAALDERDPAQQAAARQKAASAAADVGFQRFVARATGAPPNSTAGA